ncbi:MAG: hypothetical protein R3225_09860 [Halofilum sp. (in: g-proteobacteria)]|nr:hypothetical protein [Halofilum sp. (in: g-proteobacteria)]
MKASTDRSHRISGALEAVVRVVLDDPGRTGDATLATVRAALASGRLDAALARAGLGAGCREALLREIDGLVEEHGAGVAAVDLLHCRAQEALCVVIRDVVANWHDPDRAPTLADVRAAIAVGRVSALVARGLLDSEGRDMILGALNELIRVHGARVSAEQWIGPGDPNR